MHRAFDNRIPTPSHWRDCSAYTCVSSVEALFLDVDGTLLEFGPRPELVRVGADLRQLLAGLHELLGGAVALISGRTVAQLDGLFAPLRLPLAALHGAERRGADGSCHRPATTGDSLEPVRVALTELQAGLPGLLLEDKGRALALHYRGAPHAAEAVRLAMRRATARLAGYELLEGELVMEVKPSDHDKATAVEAFLQEAPFKDRRPAYLGDDYTDCDGLAAVRRQGGIDIAVGKRISARWHLAGPADVRRWLMTLRTRLRRKP